MNITFKKKKKNFEYKHAPFQFTIIIKEFYIGNLTFKIDTPLTKKVLVKETKSITYNLHYE